MNIFIISGPSGVGKSHLVHELEKIGISSIDVYTDRKRRPTEKDVTDRVYMTKEEFDSILTDFLYWFEFQGNRYGYKLQDITDLRRKKLSASLTIPPSFIEKIMKLLPEGIIIHLHVDEKDFSLLSQRMKYRDISELDSQGEKELKNKKIQNRLDFARDELKVHKKIHKLISRGNKGKIFTITNDESLYAEVIPYIRNL